MSGRTADHGSLPGRLCRSQGRVLADKRASFGQQQGSKEVTGLAAWMFMKLRNPWLLPGLC
jgi:hypothetical protein